MAILVTGGAGYIGSVTVEALRQRGEKVVVLDNLVCGHREAIEDEVPFYEGDIGDSLLVDKIVATHKITACMHFSAYASVGESVTDPRKYFRNNVVATIDLLDTLLSRGVKKFVFSSTCAIYGEPIHIPIDESHPQNPSNPYGWTKLMIEKVMESYDAAFGLRYVSLRYFNACGSTEKHGEDHDPETHLIPLVLFAALGKIPSVSVFGSDYPTPDGTAIRDYIHVSDLADAHVLAVEHLRDDCISNAFNLGNGNGYSVKEVIETSRLITGREIKALAAPRRAGDPSRLVADAAKAREILGWNPKITELKDIIQSSWEWYQRNPSGYADASRNSI